MNTRIAPTPSGYLHQGNIFNFLLNWLWARSNDGKILLRIDDADAERKRKEYVEDIFRVLDWLGLDWDIGPAGPGDFEKHWSQAKRMTLYKEILDELISKELVFACECSRKQSCNCIDKRISLSTPGAALRMKVNTGATLSINDGILGTVSVAISPFIVKRKDGIPAYQVCSLADDRHFGITHIYRGEDLLPSTAMQLYIDKQLCNPYFNNCHFRHHRLLTDTAGNKFSKSAGTMGGSIIHQTTKEALLQSFAKWMGWNSDIVELREMIGKKEFSS